MGAAKKWYESHCDKHGSPDSGDNQNIKRVTVGTPRNKRERREGGCTACAGDKKAN